MSPLPEAVDRGLIAMRKTDREFSEKQREVVDGIVNLLCQVKDKTIGEPDYLKVIGFLQDSRIGPSPVNLLVSADIGRGRRTYALAMWCDQEIDYYNVQLDSKKEEMVVEWGGEAGQMTYSWGNGDDNRSYLENYFLMSAVFVTGDRDRIANGILRGIPEIGGLSPEEIHDGLLMAYKLEGTPFCRLHL